jgi:hypothetical protein
MEFILEGKGARLAKLVFKSSKVRELRQCKWLQDLL